METYLSTALAEPTYFLRRRSTIFIPRYRHV